MASLVVVFFRTATLMLDWYWSAIIAIGAGLGTSLWSTASRGMWAHTWEMMLGGIVVYLLLAGAARRSSIRPVLLATLLSWMFFVRPVGAIPAVAVGIYILICRRARATAYVITGGLWLGGIRRLLDANLRHDGAVLLFEQRPARDGHPFHAGAVWDPAESVARHLHIFAGARRRAVSHRAKLAIDSRPRARDPRALDASPQSAIAIAAHPEWWGGNSYGPRLMSDAIPWFVLLAILAIAAIPQALRNASQSARW